MYLLYELKPKSATVQEFKDLKEAQAAAKKTKHYAILNMKEDRIVEVSTRSA
jgi:hypothetical protein